MLGNRTLVRDRFDVCSKTVVMGNITVPSQLWDRFCVLGNMSSPQCDDYFIQNNLTEIQGIPGLGSGIIRGKLVIVDWGLKFTTWHFLHNKSNNSLYAL